MQEPVIEPLTDEELLAVADDPVLSLKLTSEERRRLNRVRSAAKPAEPEDASKMPKAMPWPLD